MELGRVSRSFMYWNINGTCRKGGDYVGAIAERQLCCGSGLSGLVFYTAIAAIHRACVMTLAHLISDIDGWIYFSYPMILMPRNKNSSESGDRLSVREQVYQNGFAFLRGLSPQTPTFDVASLLGEPCQLGRDEMVQPLIPLPLSAPNTYSGNYGLDRFPFHTDLAHWSLPPRYFMLRCIKGYAQVPTLVFDGNNLVSIVGREILRRAVVRPRRPTAGKVRLLRLLGEGPDAEILRWDSLYLKPASPIGELAFAKLHECLSSIKPHTVALVEEGDTMIIDNWRMLHGRAAVMERYRDRHLERVYLGSLN